MEERIRIFLCVLAGAGGFAVMGAGFGALARVLLRASGGTAGGGPGRTAVQFLERFHGEEMTPTRASALSGAVDGACFLGVLGALLGALVAYRGPEQTGLLFQVLLGGLALVLCAAAFGVVGFLLLRSGTSAIGFVFLGGLLGAVGGSWYAGNDGLILGVLGGGLLGLGAALLAGNQIPPEPPERD